MKLILIYGVLVSFVVSSPILFDEELLMEANVPAEPVSLMEDVDTTDNPVIDYEDTEEELHDVDDKIYDKDDQDYEDHEDVEDDEDYEGDDRKKRSVILNEDVDTTDNPFIDIADVEDTEEELKDLEDEIDEEDDDDDNDDNDRKKRSVGFREEIYATDNPLIDHEEYEINEEESEDIDDEIDEEDHHRGRSNIETNEIEYMEYLTKQSREANEIEYMEYLTKQSRFAHLNLNAQLGPLGGFGLGAGLGSGMTGVGAGLQLGQLGLGASTGFRYNGLVFNGAAGLGGNYLDYSHHYSAQPHHQTPRQHGYHYVV